jgi:hypothetical protein
VIWFSTFVVVYPATESFVAVNSCPVLVVSPLAVSGGYGVQLQFVPRGTESPRATIDHVLAVLDVVAVEVLVEETGVDAAVDEDVEELDDLPQPERENATATSPTTAKPTRPLVTPRVYASTWRWLLAVAPG